MLSTRTHRIALLSLLALLAPGIGQSASVRIGGRVQSVTGTPIPGATVILLQSGAVLTGTATDNNGQFELGLKSSSDSSLYLRVSSVGYATESRNLPARMPHNAITISLSEQSVEVPGMRVTPRLAAEYKHVMKQDEVMARAAQSLVMTNPVAAIREPQVSRVGSSHSSQIRVHGTSPVYFLNGLPIGTDPAHYGMFSYVPASIVDKMEFAPLGTSADHQLPSIVQFKTPELFGRPSGADLTLSTVEATGTFSLATERLYAQGSLRKSVLDRLVKQLDISTARATLPPTNFQDAFGSFGLKLSKTTRLIMDHYQVRDFLCYNTSDVVDASSVDTRQQSREKQVGIRLEDRRGAIITRFSTSTRWGSRDYIARPSNDATNQAIRVELGEYYRTDFGQAGVNVNIDRVLIMVGLETEQDRYRDYSLEQRNWNFQPPFASTDNPFVYQQALNEAYGDRSGSAAQKRTSGFVSGEVPFGAATLSLGVRQDRYVPLRNSQFTGYRSKLGIALGEQTSLSLSWGTYSNSPLDNILESYQVMVRANLDNVSPVKTELAVVQMAWHSLGVGTFRKTLRNLPVVAPDFAALVSSDGVVDADVISVKSGGSTSFDGLFVTLQEDRLLGNRFGLTASYAYTASRTYDHGIVSRYALDVPHRFQAQVDYHCSSKLNLGAELQVRSGYPFSPLRANRSSDESRLYDWEFYRATLEDENSLRFATNAYLNLSGRYKMGRVELLMSVANITNRANPVVYSSAGLIYDAGILPMLGLRMIL